MNQNHNVTFICYFLLEILNGICQNVTLNLKAQFSVQFDDNKHTLREP